jgi:flagellar biosynthesis chaperone FliJ
MAQTLEQYRNDYLKPRLTHVIKAGSSSKNYINYQTFLKS